MDVVSKEELVAACRINGTPVDRFTPLANIRSLLGGIGEEIGGESPILDRAREMETFINEHPYELNLVCDKRCTVCATGLVIWCSHVFPKVREVLERQLPPAEAEGLRES